MLVAQLDGIVRNAHMYYVVTHPRKVDINIGYS